MSKAEERALEAFPLNIDGDSRGSYDLNVVKRIIYQQGYEQAEKDLELTWEDISKIISIDQQVCGVRGIANYTYNHQQAMEEVLKQFKERKGGMYKTWNSLRGNLKEDNQGNIVGGLKL